MKATIRRAKERKLIRRPDLRDQVIDWVKAGWTPEQIAARLRLEGAKPRVCQETIDRFVHARESLAKSIWWHLPEQRRKRRARRRRAQTSRPENSILFRPAEVAHRRRLSPWSEAGPWPS